MSGGRVGTTSPNARLTACSPSTLSDGLAPPSPQRKSYSNGYRTCTSGRCCSACPSITNSLPLWERHVCRSPRPPRCCAGRICQSCRHAHAMLAFLATLVTIVGSLYAGGSLLVEQNRLREQRLRLRLQATVVDRTVARAPAEARHRGVGGSYNPYAEESAFRALLLEANGVDSLPASYSGIPLLRGCRVCW